MYSGPRASAAIVGVPIFWDVLDVVIGSPGRRHPEYQEDHEQRQEYGRKKLRDAEGCADDRCEGEIARLVRCRPSAGRPPGQLPGSMLSMLRGVCGKSNVSRATA
jgi:hypothetical protein